jgi:hypothetical protein
MAAISYGTQHLAGRTYLIISQRSSDDETGIWGYQVAVGSAPGAVDLKSWNDSIDFHNADISAGNSWRLPNYGLRDGSYYVSLRAKNKQGVSGGAIVTGPYIVDTSPPVTPLVTCTITPEIGGLMLNMSFANISDPQSGVVKIEYGITESSPILGIGTPKLADWKSIGTATKVSKFIASVGMVAGKSYYVGARTTNGVGLVSRESWISIKVQ